MTESKPSHPFTVIIGLEVHVQLQTQTKIFCRCSTAFHPDRPNDQTCPVCLGLPGALPVLNRKAFELGVKTALALGCQIAPFTKWDRKQYFYPDLPKGYQISQFDLPFSSAGMLTLALDQGEVRSVRILRAHLEEDAGKNLHDESGRGRDSQVDLNRAGTPLVEIVTEPDLRSAAEARQLLEELRLLLLYQEVSDCNMQEGSLRCDANVNLHVHRPDGTRVATPIVEIKNLNSFRFTELAIDYEVQRQWDEFQRTGLTIHDAPKATRGFDPDRGTTFPMREKELAADYRYFPDPDLAPVRISDEWLSAIRNSMVESPAVRRSRYEQSYGLSGYDSAVIVDQGRLFADYFELVAAGCGDGKQAANWVTQDVQRELNERGMRLAEFPISATVLGLLLKRIVDRKLTVKAAREVFVELLKGATEGDSSQVVSASRIDEIVVEKGLALVADDSALDAVLESVIAANPKAVSDFRAGKPAAAGALMGQVMKQLKGADAQVVREKLLAKLNQQ